jgi:hypothetical protein
MMKKRRDDLADFYKKSGRMPSFSELGTMWGLRSKNAVFKTIPIPPRSAELLPYPIK